MPPIELTKLRPLGKNQQRVGILGDLVGFATELNFRKNCGGPVHCFLIVGANLRALGQQSTDHFEGWRKANVVGIGLKRQAQNPYLFVLDDPQCLSDFLDEQIDAALIHQLGFFEHVEVHAGTLRQPDKRLNVFGQAKAAKAESGIQKLRPNPRVESHCVDDFLDIGADLLAQIRNHVGVGNLHGQEGVGGVLDQLSAVDRGDYQRRRFR